MYVCECVCVEKGVGQCKRGQLDKVYIPLQLALVFTHTRTHIHAHTHTRTCFRELKSYKSVPQCLPTSEKYSEALLT